MNECLINPSQNKGEPCLPALGLLTLNPSDTILFSELAKKYQLSRHFLFHSNLFSSRTFFIAGPAVGAPMATICLEKLIALGAKYIFVYGWCGAISSNLSIGDVFIPLAGVSGEGTSSYYISDSKFAPDKDLTTAVTGFIEKSGDMYKKGSIWTTDALYREKREQIDTLRNQGVLAVDMEYTALASVALYRKVALSALMLVSDELYHQTWKQKVSNKIFRSKSKKILRSLCACMHNNQLVNYESN